ncbi:MAG: Na/Pi cotransporter family protein [Prevotellaceae bacterium]|jgi:phosphate:Na+ symporter|nr:Na/Pi cotransporter family protein [Prevotellaceae bacterium]
MEIVYDSLLLIGAFGLFLFGMKMLSEALQKLAGNRMRTVLGNMVATPFKRVLTGFFVTAVIQSSSAITMMVVSFVNTGLMTLTQSIGVIMGANVGATITAWIIAAVGFHPSISLYDLSVMLVAIGFPLLMLKRRRNKSWGELIIGIALLCMGLAAMKAIAGAIETALPVLSFLADYTGMGYLSILLFAAVGALLTVMLQSSNVVMALSMVVCYYGWIPFDMAVAMIAGEHIGRTISANRAAKVANVQARRAARSHFILNFIGLAWVLALFYPAIRLLVWISVSLGCPSPFEAGTGGVFGSSVIGLAMFHTLFNVCNVCLLIGFTPLLVKAATWMVKNGSADDTGSSLKYIQRGMVSTAELLQEQAKREITCYAKHATKQFNRLRELFREINPDKFDELFRKIEHDEEKADRTEMEIAAYLNKISEGELSEKSSRRLQAMYKAISEIESVSDSNYDLARIMLRKKNLGVWFDQDLRDRINALFDLLEKAYAAMTDILNKNHDDHQAIIDRIYEYETQINAMRSQLKEEHVHNLEENKYKYITGVIYLDLVIECEKLGDYIVNVSETAMELNKV